MSDVDGTVATRFFGLDIADDGYVVRERVVNLMSGPLTIVHRRSLPCVCVRSTPVLG